MRRMPKSNVIICENSSALFIRAAQLWLEISQKAIAMTGRCTIALSGGSTPRSLYQLLSTPEWSARIDWQKLQFFWGDERCVPPDHLDSNYGMVEKALLSKVPILKQNVHRVPTELAAPEKIAEAYEATLRQVFGARNSSFPQFDLILLGLGENGHTASLFPYSPALKDTVHWFAADFIQEIRAYRITLTAPVINNAKNVIFLVSGEAKADILRQVLFGKYEPQRLPAQLIQPIHGSLTWLTDKSAATLLPSNPAI